MEVFVFLTPDLFTPLNVVISKFLKLMEIQQLNRPLRKRMTALE